MKRMNEEKLNQMAEFIHRYISENNGESPKFKDILEYMQMSNSVGYRYLTTLRDRGIISYNGKDTLSIKGQETMKVTFRRLMFAVEFLVALQTITDRIYKGM